MTCHAANWKSVYTFLALCAFYESAIPKLIQTVKRLHLNGFGPSDRFYTFSSAQLLLATTNKIIKTERPSMTDNKPTTSPQKTLMVDLLKRKQEKQSESYYQKTQNGKSNHPKNVGRKGINIG